MTLFLIQPMLLNLLEMARKGRCLEPKSVTPPLQGGKEGEKRTSYVQTPRRLIIKPPNSGKDTIMEVVMKIRVPRELHSTLSAIARSDAYSLEEWIIEKLALFERLPWGSYREESAIQMEDIVRTKGGQMPYKRRTNDPLQSC